MKPYAKNKDCGYNVSHKRRKTKAIKKCVRQQAKKDILNETFLHNVRLT